VPTYKAKDLPSSPVASVYLAAISLDAFVQVKIRLFEDMSFSEVLPVKLQNQAKLVTMIFSHEEQARPYLQLSWLLHAA